MRIQQFNKFVYLSFSRVHYVAIFDYTTNVISVPQLDTGNLFSFIEIMIAYRTMKCCFGIYHDHTFISLTYLIVVVLGQKKMLPLALV